MKLIELKYCNDHARLFSSRCDIFKVTEVVNENQSGNHSNRSDTRPSLR